MTAPIGQQVVADSTVPDVTIGRSHQPSVRRCGDQPCTDCDNEGSIRRSAVGTGPTSAPAAVHDVLGSAGSPLGQDVRVFMEPRFGRDFSGVRVHTDARAAASAEAVHAKAYTVGSHIAFASGTYSPGTSAGRRLIAHELTHTIQQRDTTPAAAASLEVGATNDPAEEEADSIAEHVMGTPIEAVPQPEL